MKKNDYEPSKQRASSAAILQCPSVIIGAVSRRRVFHWAFYEYHSINTSSWTHFIRLKDGETPLEMILSFVKIDVSAAICKMTEIYIYIYTDMKPYEYLNLKTI